MTEFKTRLAAPALAYALVAAAVVGLAGCGARQPPTVGSAGIADSAEKQASAPVSTAASANAPQ
jgi:hypothetical protein